MRRRTSAAIVGGVLAFAIGTGHATAQQVPTARFASPRTAVAGAPIRVRSIDPCPILTGEYQFVKVGFTPQLKPAGEPPGIVFDGTTADLEHDGSWEVTLSAPTSAEDGITKSYSIHADCELIPDPYEVAGPGATTTTSTTSSTTTSTTAPGATTTTSTTAPTTTTTTVPEFVSTMRYALRPIYVTGFGDADAAATTGTGGTGGVTATATDSSTSGATPPGFTTSRANGSTPPSITKQVKESSGITPAGSEGDASARADAIRKELAAQGVDTSQLSDAQLLQASPVSSTAPIGDHGGIPWWAFALAAMLAVGGVMGFGVKRSASPL